MAKQRNKPSKSAAIRAALKTTESPKDVAEKLSARGIKVTPAYVSAIKAADKRKTSRPAKANGKGRKTRRKAHGGNGSNGFTVDQATELMGHAVALVAAVGPDKSRELISAAEQLSERFR